MSTQSFSVHPCSDVELLALKIRQSPQCKGIQIPGDQEVKISQFADVNRPPKTQTTLICHLIKTIYLCLQIL